jgi:hypothetical protein
MVITTNANEFAATFRRYAELNRRNLADLAIDQSRKLAIELYNQTAAVAPTQAQIAADVQKQGWKIPEKFPDGRLGRGTPGQWIGSAVAALPRRRGRKSKARGAQEAAILSSKPNLQQMQAFVIKHRTRAIKYVASGWLGAVQDLGGSLKSSSGAVNSRRGRAEVADGAVSIINDTPGMMAVDQKHGVIQKAINTRINDMRVYIARKIAESVGRAA